MTLLKHQDYARKNSACTNVKARMYSQLNTLSMNFLEKISRIMQTLQILKVAKATNSKVQELLGQCQNSINSTTCKNYANNQHNMIVNSIKNKETVEDAVGISCYIYNDSLLRNYKDFYQSGKILNVISFIIILIKIRADSNAIFVKR